MHHGQLSVVHRLWRTQGAERVTQTRACISAITAPPSPMAAPQRITWFSASGCTPLMRQHRQPVTSPAGDRMQQKSRCRCPANNAAGTVLQNLPQASAAVLVPSSNRYQGCCMQDFLSKTTSLEEALTQLMSEKQQVCAVLAQLLCCWQPALVIAHAARLMLCSSLRSTPRCPRTPVGTGFLMRVQPSWHTGGW